MGMETSRNKMVLKIGDILSLYKDTSAYHIINITETELTCMIFHKNNEPKGYTFDKKYFESYDWKPAHVKWY